MGRIEFLLINGPSASSGCTVREVGLCKTQPFKMRAFTAVRASRGKTGIFELKRLFHLRIAAFNQ